MRDRPRALRSSGARAGAPLLALQRAAGNRVVCRLVQAKLTVGPAADAYEQEADRVAEAVMRSLTSQDGAGGGPELEAGPPISRTAFRGADPLGGTDVDEDTEAAIAGARPQGRALEPALRSRMESAFGSDFGAVRIHQGPEADGLSRSLQARAFTTGADIFFARGAYQPGTRSGQALLAHELTHVVQQGAAGPIGPSLDRAPAGEEASPLRHLRRFHVTVQRAILVQLLQRDVVDSDWLKMEEPPVDEFASEDAKKKAVRKEPTIYISQRPDGPWTHCTDSTKTGYLDDAEKELGPLAPFKVLAKWGVIRAAGDSGHPFARSHLIAAEFGGQWKYTKAAKNVRFHPVELEYGRWQAAENKVKREGKRGRIIAASTESNYANRIADNIVKVIRDTLQEDAELRLREGLKVLLRAANFVPTTVVFNYQDYDDGVSFEEQWDGQADRLTVSGDSQQIYAALHELGILKDLDIAVPVELAAKTQKEELNILTREDLVRLLKRCCGNKDTKRRRQIATNLNKLAKNERVLTDAFRKTLTSQPELKNLTVEVKVSDDFRRWFDGALGGAELSPEELKVD